MTTIHEFPSILAQSYATFAHGDQVSKEGEPYIRHLERVAYTAPQIEVTGHPAPVAEDLRTLAWLHDIVEDTSVTLTVLAKVELLGVHFKPDIVTAVGLLTHDPSVNTYAEYIETIRDAPGYAGELAQRVKLADLHDHLSEFGSNPTVLPDSIVQRYLRALMTLYVSNPQETK